MNDKLQEAEESNEELQEAGAMTIISMMIDDCPLEMIYDSLFWELSRFYWTKSDRNGSETQSESRD